MREMMRDVHESMRQNIWLGKAFLYEFHLDISLQQDKQVVL